MARISANASVLERVARNLDSIAGDISSQKKKLSTAGDQTAAAWKSQYTAQYLNDASTVGKNIQSTASTVREIASQLRSTADKIRQLERELARKQRR